MASPALMRSPLIRDRSDPWMLRERGASLYGTPRAGRWVFVWFLGLVVGFSGGGRGECGGGWFGRWWMSRCCDWDGGEGKGICMAVLSITLLVSSQWSHTLAHPSSTQPPFSPLCHQHNATTDRSGGGGGLRVGSYTPASYGSSLTQQYRVCPFCCYVVWCAFLVLAMCASEDLSVYVFAKGGIAPARPPCLFVYTHVEQQQVIQYFSPSHETQLSSSAQQPQRDLPPPAHVILPQAMRKAESHDGTAASSSLPTTTGACVSV